MISPTGCVRQELAFGFEAGEVFRVSLGKDLGGVAGATSNVVVTLTNEVGEVVDTTTIHYVTNGPANSPKNPLWFGGQNRHRDL